jgi:hypothetical protein
MSTALRDIVASPRAQAALKDAGYVTIDDLTGVPVSTLAAIKGVGQVTLKALEGAAFAPDEPQVEAVWEEGQHPIHLESPYQNLAIRITDSETHMEGKRMRVVNPIFLRFENGEGRLTRDQYMLAKYRGDKSRAKAALNADEPWRIDAVEWLKAKPSHRAGNFIVLTD